MANPKPNTAEYRAWYQRYYGVGSRHWHKRQQNLAQGLTANGKVRASTLRQPTQLKLRFRHTELSGKFVDTYGCTQTEMAHRLGISKEAVRRRFIRGTNMDPLSDRQRKHITITKRALQKVPKQRSFGTISSSEYEAEEQIQDAIEQLKQQIEHMKEEA